MEKSNNNMIEKPLIMILGETEEKIVRIINETNLPAFILKPMLERILNQIQNLEQHEKEEAIRIYNQELMKVGDE